MYLLEGELKIFYTFKRSKIFKESFRTQEKTHEMSREEMN